MNSTDDVVTDSTLRFDVLGLGLHDDWPDGHALGVIAVCAGEWRREQDGRWRFYEYDED